MRFRPIAEGPTLVALSLVACMGGCPAQEVELPISGSFLQAWGTDLERSTEEWRAELKAMKAVGMNLVIVQFTVHEGKAFFNSKEFESVTGGEIHYLENLFAAADQLDMQIMLGLNSDPRWFDTAHTEDYVGTTLEPNLRLIRDLATLYAGHGAFSGWYLTEEIFDRGFDTPDRVKLLADYFLAQSALCRELTPGKPVAMSPFYSGQMQPDEYNAWWNAFLRTAGVDIVMLQDGVGVHGVKRIETMLPVYAALAKACRRHSVQIWGNVELFEQIHGWPVDDEPRATVPGSMARLARQIEAISPHVDRIVSFDFHYCLYPAGEQKDLKDVFYREYKAHYVARTQKRGR